MRHVADSQVLYDFNRDVLVASPVRSNLSLRIAEARLPAVVVTRHRRGKNSEGDAKQRGQDKTPKLFPNASILSKLIVPLEC